MSEIDNTISLLEMHKLKVHSEEWFKAAFRGLDISDWIKASATRICMAYKIAGQSDPGHIADIISSTQIFALANTKERMKSNMYPKYH